MNNSTGDPYPWPWYFGDPYWTTTPRAPYVYPDVVEPPKVNIDFDFAKPKPEGWICPQCGSVFAPWVSECYHCTRSKQSKAESTNDPPDEDEWPIPK